MIRIISGTARGTRIVCPKIVTRPTPERAREALFSILQARIEGARVLDLFAGSGALGIEALSRGAESATFVESRAEAATTIQANLQRAHIDMSRVRVVGRSVEAWLRGAGSVKQVFDLVFADPPYCKGPDDPDFAAMLLRSTRLARKLDPDGLVIIETAATQKLESTELFRLDDSRLYGKTAMHFFSLIA